ncbi:MAG: hypothetical protein U5R06_20525 [candidate division KSB1 bacterium]|nr:hypothetical protein [candidate division KSB1 bacterium]
MDRVVRYLTILSVLAFAVTIFFSPPALAAPKNSENLSKTATLSDHFEYNANTIASWVTNNGKIVDNDVVGGSGMEWPAGSDKTIDYASGLWIAGKDEDGSIRTACAEYASEFVAGPIINGAPADPDDPAYRIYVINSDGTGDWDEWPFDQGAPYEMVDGVMTPKLTGDQTLFFTINDADPATHANLFNTKPMGLEIQTSVFGYNAKNALGNMMFVKWVMINKSENDYDSVFVAVWDDPDLGDAADDLVGCDTTLGLGYCYNGSPSDATYGGAPPALGFDFFQGPEVDGEYLPMTAFSYYWNGAPDPYGDPESAAQCFEFMKGNLSDGTPLVNEVTGDSTKFAFTGDPVDGTGWVDSSPDDRRFMMASGPFTLAAGDTQVIVGAKIIAPGSNNLDAISNLKKFDAFAQLAYDKDFDLPTPPTPEMTVQGLDNQIVLVWANDPAQAAEIEEFDKDGYTFQGYNVYQGASVSGPWQRIATYDVVDDIEGLSDTYFDLESGVQLSEAVAFGKNTGISHSMVLEQDVLSGLPFDNYKKYHYAVTAYAVAPDAYPKVFESGVRGVTVLPGEYLDVQLTDSTEVGDQIVAEHVAGPGDGDVVAEIMNPLELNGHDYRVTFEEITPDPEHPEQTQIVWHLYDITDQKYVLKNQKNQNDDQNYFVVDGMMVKAQGPPPGINSIVEINPETGEIADANLLASLNNYGISQGWPTIAISGTGDADPASIDRFGTMSPKDYEIIFTDDDSTLAWSYLTDAVLVDENGNPEFLPFVMNRIDLDGTVTRLPVCVYDIDDNGKWERTFGGIFGTPAFEPLYVYDNAEYDPAKVDEYISTGNGTEAPGYGPWGVTYPAVNRFTINMYYDYGNASEGDLDEDGVFYGPPAAGEYIKIVTNKPNTPMDVFEFTARMPNTGADVAKAQLDKIKAVPNPYFGFNPAERKPTNRIMRITNLPKEGATVRIFDLAGNLVSVIDDQDRQAQGTDGATYAEWDLRNEAGVPVASGMYIMYVDVESVGSTTLKVGVINRAERLLYY